MPIASTRGRPFPVPENCRTACERRWSASLQVLVLAAAAFVWLSTSPRLVNLAQAGGGGFGGGGGSGCGSGGGSSTPNITYIYDTAGRLIHVIDPLGNVVTYTYDSDDNILDVVTTSQPSGITIDSVSPNNGSIGTSVTIFGTGFSTSCGNTVSFNGTAATVTASSATTISTTVPTGATSGPVSVNSVNGPTFTVP